MITLLVLTDGRDHIYETIPSALAHLDGPITRKIIHDDSADPDRSCQLANDFPDFDVITGGSTRLGFGGAIRHAWRYLLTDDTNPYPFHLEDDFLFRRRVDLRAMVGVLTRRPDLAQLALRRQPWNEDERAAGGVVEQHPDDYLDVADGIDRFLTHSRFFTTNPCLYRRDLIERGWPEDPHSEGKFGAQLRADCYQFAFWGPRASGEWVTHIGRERVGTGY